MLEEHAMILVQNLNLHDNTWEDVGYYSNLAVAFGECYNDYLRRVVVRNLEIGIPERKVKLGDGVWRFRAYDHEGFFSLSHDTKTLFVYFDKAVWHLHLPLTRRPLDMGQHIFNSLKICLEEAMRTDVD